MNKPRTKSKCPILQKEWDDKNVMGFYAFILRKKDIDASWKLLLNMMCNDIHLNGKITWAQQTYADKLGLSRTQINKSFKKLKELGIIIADKDSAPGKKNHYRMNYNNINLLKTCKPGETNLLTGGNKPVNWEKQTCKPGLTHNNNNKDNKSLIEEEASFRDASSSETQKADLDMDIIKRWADEDLDI